MKKRICVLMCFVVFFSSGYTLTVGFACIHAANAPEKAAELTNTLETELFDICFDNGIIATSLGKPLNGVQYYEDSGLLIGRFESEIDYLIAVYCSYADPKGKQDAAVLSLHEVRWKIIRFASLETVEKKLSAETITEQDTIKKIRIMGTYIGTHLLEQIQAE